MRRFIFITYVWQSNNVKVQETRYIFTCSTANLINIWCILQRLMHANPGHADIMDAVPAMDAAFYANALDLIQERRAIVGINQCH